MTKLKPSRPAEKHKGYYGAEPILKDVDPGVRPTAVAMQPPLKKPCAECPLRRDSAPGYLGGYTPEMYVDILYSAAMIACHSSPGFHEGDIATQRQCTGVAAFRANVGHIASVDVPSPTGPITVPTTAHTATQIIGSDTENYFADEDEFCAHHEPGQTRD